MGKPEFGRGYKESRERAEKSAKLIRSCFNCEHYFQTRSDEGEVCQNNSVLEYDMIIEGNNICCTQWELCKHRKNKKESFATKIGRARLD